MTKRNEIHAGVISSAFANFPTSREMDERINEFIRKFPTDVQPRGALDSLRRKMSVFRHLPLGLTWCLKHDITHVDILISSSMFKHLLPYDPFFKKEKGSSGGGKNQLADSYDSWPIQEESVWLWSERFRKTIAEAIEFAQKESRNGIRNPDKRREIVIPSLATNFPNLSNFSDYEHARELWRRSVFALAASLTSAHRMGVKVIEVIAGSVLDKRALPDIENPKNWRLRLFPNYTNSNGECTALERQLMDMERKWKADPSSSSERFERDFIREILQNRIENIKESEFEREGWKKHFARGIWTAYVLAASVLTKKRNGFKRLYSRVTGKKVWPDVAISVEMEPEPYRLACNPSELIDVVETARDYIFDNASKRIGDYDADITDPAIRSFSVFPSEAMNIASRIGVNLDFGHLAMFLQKRAYRESGGLAEQTRAFLAEESNVITSAEKEKLWRWIRHAHLSDHGILHNKDQVPLSILPKEFYIPLLQKFKKSCDNSEAKSYVTRKVALELEAASTTGEVGAGYHYIVEMLDRSTTLPPPNDGGRE